MLHSTGRALGIAAAGLLLMGAQGIEAQHLGRDERLGALGVVLILALMVAAIIIVCVWYARDLARRREREQWTDAQIAAARREQRQSDATQPLRTPKPPPQP